MDKLIKYILTAVLGGVIVFFLMKQCEENPNIAIQKMLFKQHREMLDSLQALDRRLEIFGDSIAIEHTSITNKYYNVYEQIDSVIYIDSTNANRVVRAWSDSLRKLLQQTFDNSGSGIRW